MKKKRLGIAKNKIDATKIIKIGRYKKKMGLSRKFLRYEYNKGIVMAKCGSAKRNITTNRVSSVSTLRMLAVTEKSVIPARKNKDNTTNPE